jgi:hypothetical protein
MNGDPQLLKPLLDDDKIEDIELQKGLHPAAVTGPNIVVKTPSSKMKTKSCKGCPCWCKCIGFTILTFIFFGVLATACHYKVFTEVVEELTNPKHGIEHDVSIEKVKVVRVIPSSN